MLSDMNGCRNFKTSVETGTSPDNLLQIKTGFPIFILQRL